MEFRVDGVDGRSALIVPAELRKVMLVHIFSIGEKDWQGEIEDLQALHKRHKEDGFAAISVAARAPGVERKLRRFASARKIAFPIGVDSPGGALDVFGVGEMPRVVLIEASGKVSLRSTERLASLLPSLKETLPRLLEERRGYIKEQERLAEERAAKMKAEEQAPILDAEGEIEAVTPEDLKKMLEDGEDFGLYFVGIKEDFEEKRIPRAVFVHIGEVDGYFEGRGRGERIVLYCGCGESELGASGRAAIELYRKGFKNVAYLEGHIHEWEARGFPLIKGTHTNGG
ncbi:MAG: rhodanese-like domain-containing protein [Elusimicrobiota bacterium]